jgi:hypothetical protein
MTSMPRSSRSPNAAAPSHFSRRDVRFGLSGRSLEIAPVIGGRRAAGVVGGVVVVELSLSLLRDHPKDAQVQIGHDHPAPGSGIGIETARTLGSAWGTSSATNSLNPTTPSARAIGCGGRPHSGQLVTYAATAAVNRNRQLRQPIWVMADPFRLKRDIQVAVRASGNRSEEQNTRAGRRAPLSIASSFHVHPARLNDRLSAL